MISIILVEDQAMLRESLEHTLNDQDDMTVVAALSDAADSIDAVARTQADCVLMDVCTENDSSGIVAARKIKEAHPETRVIIMTGMPEITFIEQAREDAIAVLAADPNLASPEGKMLNTHMQLLFSHKVNWGLIS